jgi:hypothetical protein
MHHHSTSLMFSAKKSIGWTSRELEIVEATMRAAPRACGSRTGSPRNVRVVPRSQYPVSSELNVPIIAVASAKALGSYGIEDATRRTVEQFDIVPASADIADAEAYAANSLGSELLAFRFRQLCAGRSVVMVAGCRGVPATRTPARLAARTIAPAFPSLVRGRLIG